MSSFQAMTMGVFGCGLQLTNSSCYSMKATESRLSLEVQRSVLRCLTQLYWLLIQINQSIKSTEMMIAICEIGTMVHGATLVSLVSGLYISKLESRSVE